MPVALPLVPALRLLPVVDDAPGLRQERFAVDCQVDASALAALLPPRLEPLQPDRLRLEWIAAADPWSASRLVRLDLVVACALDGESCDFVAASLGEGQAMARGRSALTARLLADPRQVVASLDRDGERLLTAVMLRQADADIAARRQAAARLARLRCRLRRVADVDGAAGVDQLTGDSVGRVQVLAHDAGSARLHLIPPVEPGLVLPYPLQAMGAQHVVAIVSGGRQRLLADYLRPDRRIDRFGIGGAGAARQRAS